MNAAFTPTNTSGSGGFLTGKGFLPEMVLALVILLILHILFFAAEMLYRQYKAYDKSVVELLPLTYSAENKTYTVSQNPFDTDGNPISLSDNERSGIEFSYHFHIYVNPNTFKADPTKSLLHVFHKGYSHQYPLLGPGVYMLSNENKMRIYMNAVDNWNKYCEVENFPVQKWVAVAIVMRENALEVFINGDLKTRMPFTGSTPYQNYQHIYAFSQRQVLYAGDDAAGTNPIRSIKGTHRVTGPFTGMLSRLRYFNYSLSYTEIAALMREGPNPKVADSSADKPPYFVDTWWTTSYSNP